MEDKFGGFFSIDIDSDTCVQECEKVPRDFQSEENFQQQRKIWTPENEAGEIWKTLKLPIDNPTKSESQTILHAIEELYFFKRYEEARKLTEKVLTGKLNDEFRKTVLDYKGRCEARPKANKG